MPRFKYWSDRKDYERQEPPKAKGLELLRVSHNGVPVRRRLGRSQRWTPGTRIWNGSDAEQRWNGAACVAAAMKGVSNDGERERVTINY